MIPWENMSNFLSMRGVRSIKPMLHLSLWFILLGPIYAQASQPKSFTIGFLGYRSLSTDQDPGIYDLHTKILRTSFEVGCQLINNDPEFREHLQLECVSNSLDDNLSNTATACVEMIERNNAVALVGPLRSDHSAACTDALSRYEVAQVSPSSTRPQLSRGNRYPGFFRTCAPDQCFVTALVDLLNALDVGEMGSLCEKSMGQFASNFQVDAGQAGVNVIAGSCIEDSPDQLLKKLHQLRKFDRAINLLALGPKTVEHAMATFQEVGMMGCPITWLFHDSSVLYDMNRYSAMSGAIGVLPHRGSGPQWERFYGQMDQEVSRLGIDVSAFPKMLYASQTFDAVSAIAHALRRGIIENGWDDDSNGEKAQNLTQQEVSTEILDQLLHMDSNSTGFPGASMSTPMYFHDHDEYDGECRGPVRLDIVNQQGRHLAVIGHWTPDDGLALRRDSLIWSNGKTGNETQAAIERLSQNTSCPT